MKAALDGMLAQWGRLVPGYAAAALLVYLASHLITALRLQAVLVGLRLPTRLRESFFANLCSIFVNNVTPGRVGGEVCRVVLLNRRAGVDLVRAAVALAYDRLTDLVPLALMVALSIPTLRRLIPDGSSAGRVIALVAATILLAIAGMIVFLRSARGEALIAEWRDRFLRFRIERSAMARAVAWSGVMFALDLLRLILVAKAFGVWLPPFQAVVLSVVSIVGGLVPTPGGIGAIEGGLCGALVLFGDSFSWHIAPLFSRFFRTVVFLHSPFFHDELIETVPGVRAVVSASVERFLCRAEPDVARPEAHAYPAYLGKQGESAAGESARRIQAIPVVIPSSLPAPAPAPAPTPAPAAEGEKKKEKHEGEDEHEGKGKGRGKGHGKKHGLERADEAAGEHGKHGRDNARGRGKHGDRGKHGGKDKHEEGEKN